jgi:hypothetical protein
MENMSDIYFYILIQSSLDISRYVMKLECLNRALVLSVVKDLNKNPISFQENSLLWTTTNVTAECVW